MTVGYAIRVSLGHDEVDAVPKLSFILVVPSSATWVPHSRLRLRRPHCSPGNFLDLLRSSSSSSQHERMLSRLTAYVRPFPPSYQGHCLEYYIVNPCSRKDQEITSHAKNAEGFSGAPPRDGLMLCHDDVCSSGSLGPSSTLRGIERLQARNWSLEFRVAAYMY
jgi:hypothetical protein